MKNLKTKQKSSRDKIRQVLKVLAIVLDIYAVGLIAFLLIMLLPVRPRIVEILCNLLDWALMPSLLMVIIFTALRRWHKVALWMIPAFAFILLFGGLFVLKGHALNLPGTHLKVMTWNLMGSIDENHQEQIDILRDSGADIIALQEVSQSVTDLIDTQLVELYPYRVLYPKDVQGTGLLSKYPIESDNIVLPAPEGFYSLKAVLDINGAKVTVLSMHPRARLIYSQNIYTKSGSKHLNDLLNLLSLNGPVLMMGDFNMSDQMSDHKLLTQRGYTDIFREVGWGFGFTWPVRYSIARHLEPFIRIDYIWHTEEFKAGSVRVGKGAVSDHLPVIAELVYAP
jgi:vancomycin resistance protein VanJ